MRLLENLTNTEQPDIICLQETKVQDIEFPLDAIQKLGYEHVAFRGEKSYNGVAIISKVPLVGVEKQDVAGSKECRHICAILPGDIELHNFYIPAGGDEPDVAINPKYKFKLEFVDYMDMWFGQNRKASDKIIIVGDFNIAPMEHDVWSSKQLQNVVSHTAPEISRLNSLKGGLNWIDIGRHFVPESQKLYSWWSYRNKDWRKSNRGRRLDHIWATPALKAQIQAYSSLESARDWTQPSDHVPVIADFNSE
jgi:exodeoxyribonuclease-3